MGRSSGGYTENVKALVLVLALALTPLGKMVCQVTCLAAATSTQPAAPSCHEDGAPQAGATLKTSGACHHSDAQLLLVKAGEQFQVTALLVEKCRLAVFIAPAIGTIELTALRSSSPPPLLLPLRM